MQELKTSEAADATLETAVVPPGGSGTFERVYGNYGPLVRRVCHRVLRNPVEAEDASQDVFVRLFRKLDTFRGEAAFSTWLYRLTINVALGRLRGKRARLLLEATRDERAYPCESGVLDTHLTGLTDRIDLESAVRLLPTGYKAAFILHDVHGYHHREIAQMFGYSIANSKSQLHKARRRLRILLQSAAEGPYKRARKTHALDSSRAGAEVMSGLKRSVFLNSSTAVGPKCHSYTTPSALTMKVFTPV